MVKVRIGEKNYLQIQRCMRLRRLTLDQLVLIPIWGRSLFLSVSRHSSSPAPARRAPLARRYLLAQREKQVQAAGCSLTNTSTLVPPARNVLVRRHRLVGHRTIGRRGLCFGNGTFVRYSENLLRTGCTSYFFGLNGETRYEEVRQELCVRFITIPEHGF
jgi:hypothetical protein